jgi:ABC-type nickel/cobalt efflux system permease component RcnA
MLPPWSYLSTRAAFTPLAMRRMLTYIPAVQPFTRPLDGRSPLQPQPHLPPGADGSGDLAQPAGAGHFGGLLPCPSALVVLLSAIALDRTVFGLVLVLAFSLGLAGVLTGIGLVFVYAGRLFERMPVQSPVLRILPALSALFISLAGIGIAVKALIEIGLLKL